ncbi:MULTISPECIES: 1,4-dihydroxy-2-naphthoate polyprenyltransferase [unclassified Motilimonas]|uniref:1,4-dihydroxy-2-naphthoate polyprenyltransferase n=1 Tax=Motilimonas TaxID=1914248 RepID=UPI001E389A2F|nr:MULTISPECIES: 1,4-dihydroxy-2-naphthoate polyprenyltransferase [unclassified Motilimonas]MCE0559111.1 1,4-dihydroxy-2-naphthoate polyprenyltransferase [Motilimonas sp. E26]MDO6527573.1 1,4-dihydroxy-2-naphthoate polyprenyltransferase [Motilimonas sp. 1_MG-2023]
MTQKKSWFSIWLPAIRPRTLPLACASIVLAAGLAWQHQVFNPWILILCLSTAILLQIISNLANDYGDAVTGADNEQRIGPQRTMQTGLVTQQQMKTAIGLTTILAVASGLILLNYVFADHWQQMLVFVGLGLLSILAAVTYTMGKHPYGYMGLGDLSVFIFFGLLGVLGSFYLYGLALHAVLILPAVSCGLLATAVLNINNTRDIDTDKQAGKHTLALRLGRTQACRYQWWLLAGAVSSTLLYQWQLPFSSFNYLFLLALWPLMQAARTLQLCQDGERLNGALKQTALASFGYCCLLALGWVMTSP